MSKKKKKKKKQRNPKLSSADKFIYGILYIIALLLASAPIFLFYFIKNKIVFADSNVIAYEGTNELWCILPFLIYAGLITIPVLDAYTDRKPILHRKKQTKKTKKPIYKISVIFITVCAIIYIAMLVPCVGALYSRNQITSESISVYTLFNKFKEEIPLSSAQSVEISIAGMSSSKSYWHWEIIYKIKCDNGKTYYFSPNTDQALKMYELFPDTEKNIKNAHKLDKYLKDRHCTPEQIKALQEIFSVSN